MAPQDAPQNLPARSKYLACERNLHASARAFCFKFSAADFKF
ncbi:hypothetical protein CAMGR0001_1538 [Campylobacter gracilis RM3268]|uniref:Uncharacterized protein n=1 Tax=Campylobacter gracilis RM3268 TaxID=553220 RepID=C8PJY7_9BACT|nr:hypothetical protein CAMGR0001_1538 [Campylobacter gracilis RM3268]